MFFCGQRSPFWDVRLFGQNNGSTENWLCQDLNFYVNSKTPFSQEESDYASCWVQQRTEHLFTLKVEQEEREETGDEKPPEPQSWDPLKYLPPPYNPPPPSHNPGNQILPSPAPVTEHQGQQDGAMSAPSPPKTHCRLKRELEQCM